jgi:hypothetical protein
MSWRSIDWILYDRRLAELTATGATLGEIAAELGVSESSADCPAWFAPAAEAPPSDDGSRARCAGRSELG